MNLINLPITHVVVMEDRAQITRSGRIELEKGRNKLIISEISPVVSDKSLSADLKGGKLSDIRIKRAYKEEQQAQGLDKKLEEIQEEYKKTAIEKDLTEISFEFVDNLIKNLLNDLSVDASWGKEHPWLENYSTLTKNREDYQEKLSNLTNKMNELNLEITNVKSQINATTTPKYELKAQINLSIESDGGKADLKVTYIVPNACWRPMHVARLLEKTVEITTTGCVWQNTGENWDNVELTFSTQRPSLGAEPPKLTDDRLWLVHKQPDVLQYREEAVDQAPSIDKRLPGIDDGGEEQILKTPDLVSVPSNGRPYQAKIQERSCECSTRLVCYPELLLAAVNEAKLKNNDSKPILAGPVELIGLNGSIGKTELNFIKPGQEFSLGFGPEPRIRIKRTEIKDNKTATVSFWDKELIKVTIYLSNIGTQDLNLTVIERIPVSEVEQAQITLDQELTTENFEGPDKDGFVTFNRTLTESSIKRIDLAYLVATKKSSSTL